MSTIDTAEAVRELIARLDAEPFTRDAQLLIKRSCILENYAALLDLMNRPVSAKDVETAMCIYFGDDMREALEHHMAALREEVGK